jgi:hypothetical protein
MSEHIRAADHAMGLELQLEELVEQRRRALTQGRTDDASAISLEITELQNELATTAEEAVAKPGPADLGPVIHGATELRSEREPS